jgi:hypothetical protein
MNGFLDVAIMNVAIVLTWEVSGGVEKGKRVTIHEKDRHCARTKTCHRSGAEIAAHEHNMGFGEYILTFFKSVDGGKVMKRRKE